MNQKFIEFIEYSKKKQQIRSTKKIDELSQQLKKAKQTIRNLKQSQQQMISIFKDKQLQWQQQKRGYQMHTFKLKKQIQHYKSKAQSVGHSHIHLQTKSQSYKLLEQENRELKAILKQLFPKAK